MGNYQQPVKKNIPQAKTSEIKERVEGLKKIDWEDVVRKKELEIQALLPDTKSFKVEAVQRLTIKALESDSKLRKCTPISLINALMDALAVGIVPFTMEAEGYIIPYGEEAQFQFGYRGIIKVCYNSPLFKLVVAKVVRGGDDFDYLEGREEPIQHRPLIFDQPKEYLLDSNVKAFYSKYKLMNGGIDVLVWSREQMEKHRDRYAKTYKRDPHSVWGTSFVPMGLKTILTHGLKYAPRSREMEEVYKRFAFDKVMKRELAPEPSDFTPDAEADFVKKRRLEVEGDVVLGNNGVIPPEVPEDKKTEPVRPEVVEWNREECLKRCWGIAQKIGYDEVGFGAEVNDKYGKTHSKDLTDDEVKDLEKSLMGEWDKKSKPVQGKLT